MNRRRPRSSIDGWEGRLDRTKGNKRSRMFMAAHHGRPTANTPSHPLLPNPTMKTTATTTTPAMMDMNTTRTTVTTTSTTSTAAEAPETLRTLQRALEANRNAQKVLQQHLHHLQQQQHDNRQRALSCIQHLYQRDTMFHSSEDDSSSSSSAGIPIPTLSQVKAFLFHQLSLAQNVQSNETQTNPPPPPPQQQQQEQQLRLPWSVRRIKICFVYDENRRWENKYFVDPLPHKLDRPRPNRDVLRRHEIRRRDLFIPTKDDLPIPGRGAEHDEETVRETAVLPDGTTTVGADDGRQRRRSRTKQIKSLSKDGLSQLIRLIEDQRIPSKKNPSARMNRPSVCLITDVTANEEEEVDDDGENVDVELTFRIDWDKIQQGMNSIYPTMPHQTRWNLMAAYARYSVTQLIENHPMNVTNPKQDEFLLRYLALQGPQLVWDNIAVGPLSSGTALSSLGDPVAGHQLILRSHGTSFNLTLTPTPYWKTNEEQKLLLLIKIYQQSNDHEGQGGNDHEDVGDSSTRGAPSPEQSVSPRTATSKTSSRKRIAPPPSAAAAATTTGKGTKPHTDASWAITYAATHFPNRTRDQVRRKWERSIDPALDHQPFTEEEDSILKQAIQDALETETTSPTTISTMADVARIHFPNRKSHQIYARWLEIGTPEEIIAFDAKQVIGVVPRDFHVRFK